MVKVKFFMFYFTRITLLFSSSILLMIHTTPYSYVQAYVTALAPSTVHTVGKCHVNCMIKRSSTVRFVRNLERQIR
jgi:hypothetical protein